MHAVLRVEHDSRNVFSLWQSVVAFKKRNVIAGQHGILLDSSAELNMISNQYRTRASFHERNKSSGLRKLGCFVHNDDIKILGAKQAQCSANTGCEDESCVF